MFLTYMLDVFPISLWKRPVRQQLHHSAIRCAVGDDNLTYHTPHIHTYIHTYTGKKNTSGMDRLKNNYVHEYDTYIHKCIHTEDTGAKYVLPSAVRAPTALPRSHTISTTSAFVRIVAPCFTATEQIASETVLFTCA